VKHFSPPCIMTGLRSSFGSYFFNSFSIDAL
jgi:hypothetical protein